MLHQRMSFWRVAAQACLGGMCGRSLSMQRWYYHRATRAPWCSGRCVPHIRPTTSGPTSRRSSLLLLRESHLGDDAEVGRFTPLPFARGSGLEPTIKARTYALLGSSDHGREHLHQVAHAQDDAFVPRARAFAVAAVPEQWIMGLDHTFLNEHLAKDGDQISAACAPRPQSTPCHGSE